MEVLLTRLEMEVCSETAKEEASGWKGSVADKDEWKRKRRRRWRWLEVQCVC